jgi:hypothetical protein
MASVEAETRPESAVVVTTDQLAALDLLIWLRTGREAALRLGLSQSSAARQSAEAARVLRVRPKRVGGEWQLDGDGRLIAMERQVHQRHRLMGGRPLRLECDLWNVAPLALPLPPHWITGTFDHLRRRPLELLRKRVLDAWISCFYPDLPGADDPELLTVPLTRFPLWVMADRHHPLAGARGLSGGDLERFPSLALPPGEMPFLERTLQAQGLWNQPVRMRRYCYDDWEGRTADRVTLSFGNTIGQRLSPDLVPLDWDLGHPNGQALVVRRDIAEAGPIQDLLDLLRRRTTALQAEHPHLELV